LSSPARLRVLFVSTGLGGASGGERFTATALAWLGRAHFEPELCLLGGAPSESPPPDVPLHRISGRRPWPLPAAAAALARIVERRRPAVLLSAFAQPSFVAGHALLLARRRPRWIARVAADPGRSESRMRRAWMAALYRRADLVLCNSEALCRRFAQLHPGAAPRHLANAVDFGRIERLAQEAVPRPPAGRRRIAAAGRLEPVKRFDLLLGAVACLRSRLDVEVVICGEGSQRRALEAQARRLGLDGRVLLPGFVANPWAWLASADLFALSSDSEGLPHALIEAQGLGLAAVATDCETGPREIVSHGQTGLLVPPGSAAALADAAAELLFDEPRRRALASRAREQARARFAAAPLTLRLEEYLLAASGG
jgi:glycosyltransferase involved in cell wall biosynthesis